MNAKIINAILFTVGAAAGSAITWKLVKDKYEKRAQEEIDSVKETYSRRANIKVVPKEEVTASEQVTADIENITVKKKAKDIIKEKGYTNYTQCCRPNDPNNPLDAEDYAEELAEAAAENDDDERPLYADRDTDCDRPYVISPDEFGDLDGYETISLTYFSDGILADERDELIESIDEIVGLDSLETFGEYEDDSVFVRNDRLRCDYEILKDFRRWEDVVNPPKPKTRKTQAKKPHQMED